MAPAGAGAGPGHAPGTTSASGHIIGESLGPKAESIADMLREGWDVVSWCDVCHLEMAVDLASMIKLKGPGVSLWNRTPPCRRLRCKGRAHFKARIPGLYQYRELVAPWPDDVPPRPTQGELAARRKAENCDG